MDITPPPRARDSRLQKDTHKRCLKRTLEFMQQEADNGEVYAQAMLGDYLYKEGTSCKKDMEKAADLYQKASHAGDIISTHNLAVMHWNGLGDVIKQDKKRAIELFGYAGSQGHNMSLFKAGLALECGFDDVKPQPEISVSLYMSAALRGHAESQYRTGLLYIQGRGVLVDLDRARWILRMAAEQGHKRAAEELQKIESPESTSAHIMKRKRCNIHRPTPCHVVQQQNVGINRRAFRNILPEIEAVQHERGNDDSDDDDDGAEGANDGTGNDNDTRGHPPTSYGLEVLAEMATGNDSAENASFW